MDSQRGMSFSPLLPSITLFFSLAVFPNPFACASQINDEKEHNTLDLTQLVDMVPFFPTGKDQMR